MAVVTPRVRSQIVNNPNLIKDVMIVYEELDRLVRYYKDEIKQVKIKIKMAKEPDEIKFLTGSLQAYCDHLAEVEWIGDVLRGWKHDEGDE